MENPNTIEPVLPLLSIIGKQFNQLPPLLSKLRRSWENFTLIVPPYRFDTTDYYKEEMGSPLFRWWGYRHSLSNPADLTQWKQQCQHLEQKFAREDGSRTVNLDPGYLNYGLVVLGSHKYDLQKIYLGNGVYADPVLQFVDGDFQPFEWSFPDFKNPDYYPLLKNLRDRYRVLRRKENH